MNAVRPAEIVPDGLLRARVERRAVMAVQTHALSHSLSRLPARSAQFIRQFGTMNFSAHSH